MWPHAPLHRFDAEFFMVTSGTLHKLGLFDTPEKLEMLQNELFELANRYEWQLQAWALFGNHYHFVARCEGQAESLRKFLRHFHANTARFLNRMDGTQGRQVWFQFWDTRLTFEKSYLARLRYTHQNPVKHGLVSDARQYRFGSAHWFEKHATSAFQATLATFAIDKLNVPDDF